LKLDSVDLLKGVWHRTSEVAARRGFYYYAGHAGKATVKHSTEVRSKPLKFLFLSLLLTSFSISSTCTSETSNGSAKLVYRAIHTPCGALASETVASKDRPDYTFTGYEKESTLSMLDANARMYQPALCRMSSVDPVDQPGTSAYTYALNNPVNMIDPDGAWAWPVIWRLLAMGAQRYGPTAIAYAPKVYERVVQYLSGPPGQAMLTNVQRVFGIGVAYVSYRAYQKQINSFLETVTAKARGVEMETFPAFDLAPAHRDATGVALLDPRRFRPDVAVFPTYKNPWPTGILNSSANENMGLTTTPKVNIGHIDDLRRKANQLANQIDGYEWNIDEALDFGWETPGGVTGTAEHIATLRQQLAETLRLIESIENPGEATPDITVDPKPIESPPKFLPPPPSQ